MSYINKDGSVQDVKTYYGQKWSEIKTDNKTLNSIFTSVDDGDGVIQAKELNKLNKLLLYIDNLVQKTANNEILEQEELDKFQEKLDNKEIDIDEILNDNNIYNTNWSENIDRNLTRIIISPDKLLKAEAPQLEQELRDIANEQGFDLSIMNNMYDAWIEDAYIRRHDGKIYIPYHSNPTNDGEKYLSTYTNENDIRSVDGGTKVASRGKSFKVKIKNKDKYYGTSYLEGGNVLNTRTVDGKPSAIVGESSIGTTLSLMNLEPSKENIELVKQQIAEDLGLEKSQVTFIPQFDFHIDMMYHPLHNGEIAVPDFDAAISFLENNDIPSMNQPYEGIDEEYKDCKTEKDKRIKILKKLRDETAILREDAEKKLSGNGYKLVKIPYFTTSMAQADSVNFMNGVGGTSKKTGQSFFITNKSEYPELQAFIESYFKNAGIDKVYFVSTDKMLGYQGGIDCLTQEE